MFSSRLISPYSEMYSAGFNDGMDEESMMQRLLIMQAENLSRRHMAYMYRGTPMDDFATATSSEMMDADGSLFTPSSQRCGVGAEGDETNPSAIDNTAERPDLQSWTSPGRRSRASTSSSIHSSESDSKLILNLSRDTLPNSEMPYDDGSVAFGTIRLYVKECADTKSPRTFIRGAVSDEPYPNLLVELAIKRKWLRMDGLSIGTIKGITHVRIYVVPEDVDRANRGTIKDFRKVIKHLLQFVDKSVDCWTGKADPEGLVKIYERPMSDDEESLFYIFNTLKSPDPQLSTINGDAYSLQAMSDALEDEVAGLKTKLYPYQKRSVAAMIQKESAPAKLRDPRKTRLLDKYGNTFYLDFHEGAVFRHQPLYTEPQGGILAETMGYGKTLICLALIMATRGHYPQIPPDRVDLVPFEPRTKTASLLSMSARKIKHEGVPWKQEFHAMTQQGYHFERCIKELQQYDRAYAEPIFNSTTPSRKGKRDSANIVRLSSATLVIVPPNLLVQWRYEISTHVKEDALDPLVIDSPSDLIPAWRELVQYDVILMSKPRFEQEYRDDDLNTGRTHRGEERYRSPLTDVRWLRVICDEGHGFAGSTSKTNAMAMLDKMYIERRWVVSGTPSSTLHGVEVGLSTTYIDPGSPKVSRKASLKTALKSRKNPDAHDLEEKDLERLRLIVVNFLKLQPWTNQRGSSDKGNWKLYLAPTLGEDGKRHTPTALREVLQTLIVRHRIEDIDVDLTLPPLYNKIVYLQPSYYDKLTNNLFMMILASNYVTSEREDEDYMFHPRNRKKFDILISNLRQATFHWVGITESNVRDTIHVSNEYLTNNLDRLSDADGIMLTEAIMNGERALADPGWKAFATVHEIGAYVSNLPRQVREKWALDGLDSDPVLMGTVQARELQKLMRSQTISVADVADAGVKAMAAARNRAAQDPKGNGAKTDDTKSPSIGTADEPRLKRQIISSSPSKTRTSSTTTTTQPPTSPTSPTAARAQILGFTSSKLSYLISSILSLPAPEKVIIFYSSNNTAFFIAEALELCTISFLIYSNTLSVAKRASYLSAFNADTTKVLLMDVKQAAHGLHVACASRVFIVNPIWDAARESQAIKRAHRIGQRRPVYVETLVLKDSFEEALIRRRAERTDTKSGGVLDDRRLVERLKDLSFFKFSHEDEHEDKVVRLDGAVPFVNHDPSTTSSSAVELGNGAEKGITGLDTEMIDVGAGVVNDVESVVSPTRAKRSVEAIALGAEVSGARIRLKKAKL